MELADILSEGSILACAEVKSKSELLSRIADRAAAITGQDAEAILEALSNREALGSTGLGNGIAIPHGKLPGLTGVVAIFARLDRAVDFDAVDDQPVDIVMTLLAPMGAGADHLKALARVARVLRTERLVEDLRRTGNERQLYALLTAPVASHQAA